MDNKDIIKELAKWIATNYSFRKIIDGCSCLIDEYECAATDYYEIEDSPEDGFLGCEDWYVHFIVTPTVECRCYGYVGCDPDEIERVIDDIIGVSDCCVKDVVYTDVDGNEVYMLENERRELSDEMMKIWKEQR